MTKRKVKIKRGIKLKIMLFICLSSIIVTIVGISLTYILGRHLLINTIVDSNREISRIFATYISEGIAIEADDIRIYCNSPLWRKEIIDDNLKYLKGEISPTPEYFKGMDEKWLNAKDGDPFFNEYMANYLAGRLKALNHDDKNIVEIFITDIFGGLVAASEKTSDFYQADEEWWQKTYDGGRGKTYIGNIEIDRSTGSWIIPIGIPVRDEKGELIGICKAGISMQRFFERIDDFELTPTTHAFLVDNSDYIIYHRSIKPMSVKYAYDKDLVLLKEKELEHNIIQSPYHKGNVLVTSSKVESGLLNENGVFWKVFVAQNTEEAFRPLHKLVIFLIIIGIVMVIIVIPVGYIFGGIFVRPIKILHNVVDKILKGDWDYRVNINTKDEIEDLSNDFYSLVTDLGDKQKELIKAKMELEDFSKGLEIKVEERTKELTETQEATLNIMEDLVDSKDKLDEYSKKLEEAFRIKSDFTSMVSHELRTPLTAIKEGIEIVYDGAAGPIKPEQKDFLAIAKRNVDRLARLINDVLDFQKLEAGKLVFRIEPSDINEVISEVLKIMEPVFEKKKIALVTNLGENLPKINLDRDRIIQVITNLMDNALKFTEEGRVTVISEEKDDFIRVAVKDTGPGIKAELIPELFQKFTQLERGGMRKTGGTGLGLAISKAIIEGHGGTIWAESEFGKGSTFHFALPMV